MAKRKMSLALLTITWKTDKVTGYQIKCLKNEQQKLFNEMHEKVELTKSAIVSPHSYVSFNTTEGFVAFNLDDMKAFTINFVDDENVKPIPNSSKK